MKNAMVSLAVLLLVILSGAQVTLAATYTNTNQPKSTMSMHMAVHPKATTSKPTMQTRSPQSTVKKAAATQQTDVGVTIQNFAFMPASLTVPQGATVTWTNNDTTAHTVTGNTSGGPQSGTLQPRQSYSFTFMSAGTFAYHCSIHPMMTGQVVVTAAPAPTPAATTAPSAGGSRVATTMVSNTPAATTPAAQTTPASLPNTGAGNVWAIVGTVVVLATVAHSLYRRTNLTRE